LRSEGKEERSGVVERTPTFNRIQGSEKEQRGTKFDEKDTNREEVLIPTSNMMEKMFQEKFEDGGQEGKGGNRTGASCLIAPGPSVSPTCSGEARRKASESEKIKKRMGRRGRG